MPRLPTSGCRQDTEVHIDFVYMSCSSDPLHTVQVPFSDIEVEQGTLCVCKGSNLLRLVRVLARDQWPLR